MVVAEQSADIGGIPVRWLQAGEAPVLYVHGVPNTGEMWRPFLEQTGGIAPDLPGFGRSGKPGNFDYTVAGYDRFLSDFTRSLELDRFRLVVHDWGAVALALAQRSPKRIERLVLLSAVPFLAGYRWHRVARIWRVRGLGELFMGAASKRALKRLVPAGLVDDIWHHFDHGTQRAILRLYRSAPEHQLALAGEALDRITCPALVVWGTRDPYLPAELARRYADALGGEASVELAEAGHWPWLERPELVERTVRFVGADVG